MGTAPERDPMAGVRLAGPERVGILHAHGFARGDVSLAERLAATPPGAEIRGVFFHLVEQAIEDEQGLQRRASRTLRREYAMYPVRSYLRFVHTAARVHEEAPERAIERWHGRAMQRLLCSGLARVFLRRADCTPLGMLRRLERSRALLASYGDWRVCGREGDVTIDVRDEWVWIREVWLPSIASIFPALDLGGVPMRESESPRKRGAPRIECEFDGPFRAAIRVRW